MSAVPERLAADVAHRAGGRCEYCHLAQAGQEARFHVDHVFPSSAGGPTVLENLALACVSCSLRKGARHQANDPLTDQPVSLFNPRTQAWDDHFRWQGFVVAGLTATGRATIAALAMNRPLIVAIRQEEQLRGRFP
ncbi:HNH endonuclease [bacterium]|jgi:hypothetical protein|nr:HNH endonuclease [bacterium]